jgi:general secretion pathway protein D
VRIGVNKASNSLLIFASPSRWVQIQRILGEIDRPASQVMIEASILEVRLSNDLKYGVDWSALSTSGKLGVNSIYNDSGTIGPSFPGFSVTYLSGDIQAAVSALGSKTDIEVVSAPKIVTLDNHVAKLQIGDQVPIVTQSSQSTTTGTAALINTVDYRNTGVILNVTPRITGDNRVVLDVAQEVSSVAKTITSGIDSPTIQQRKFESTLVLENGSVVALGGLISRTRTHNDVGMPGLSKIPMVGNLFKSDSRDDARTELIVLLTARILSDKTSTDQTMADLLADMHEIESRGLLPSPR